MTITVQQQLISARLRHLFAHWAKAGGEEPPEPIVEETFEVLKELGDGDLEAAGIAVESFNSDLLSEDPVRSGVATAVGEMFLEGHLDCCGLKDGHLVWVHTELGKQTYG